MCLGIVFLMFLLLGVCWTSWIGIVFNKFGKVLPMVSLNVFSAPLSFSFNSFWNSNNMYRPLDIIPGLLFSVFYLTIVCCGQSRWLSLRSLIFYLQCLVVVNHICCGFHLRHCISQFHNFDSALFKIISRSLITMLMLSSTFLNIADHWTMQGLGTWPPHTHCWKSIYTFWLPKT